MNSQSPNLLNVLFYSGGDCVDIKKNIKIMDLMIPERLKLILTTSKLDTLKFTNYSLFYRLF